MKIFIEYDDGEKQYVGSGNAFRFRAVLLGCGSKDSVVVGYADNGQAVVRGFTSVTPRNITVREIGSFYSQQVTEWDVTHKISRA